jgi:hypothetical protein
MLKDHDHICQVQFRIRRLSAEDKFKFGRAAHRNQLKRHGDHAVFPQARITASLPRG